MVREGLSGEDCLCQLGTTRGLHKRTLVRRFIRSEINMADRKG